jgi:hypothetical protein
MMPTNGNARLQPGADTSDNNADNTAGDCIKQSSKTSIGLHLYNQIFANKRRAGRGPLDRSSLTPPLQYLTELGLLKRKPRGNWAAISCPVHKGGAEKNPSLNISMVDGHFRCMACGVSGGDLVALHRLITGVGFLDAVRDLGGHFHD